MRKNIVKFAIKRTFLVIAMLLMTIGSWAQFDDAASFSVSHKKVSATEIIVTFKGSIKPGWHVYTPDNGSGGPTPASFNIDNATGVKKEGGLKTIGSVKKQMEPMFGMEVSWVENSCTFEQKLVITDKNYSIKGYLEYGACNDKTCAPPTAVDFNISGTDGPGTEAATPANAKPEEKAAETTLEEQKAEEGTAKADSTLLTKPDTIVNNAGDTTVVASTDDLWTSKIDELKALGEGQAEGEGNSTSLWWLFLMGLVGGLIALFTPCVWPIIPMTVSFFLKRSEKKSHGVRDAIIYGLSIIVIYVALGLAITLIFGASALNALSTNAIVNIFFFLLLIAFGISFLGVFEMTLPSSWTNKADAKADSTTGFLSIFIMAFTLALVSFSCTGPIIGFVLVEVASMQNIVGPLVAMFGFALALALPFTLFALFPTLLKKAPKSGSWMNTLKVVLGFVELAFAFKFLSVADLAYGWHILDRDVFVAIWIILAVALGLYLMGWMKLPIDGKKKAKRTPVKIVLGIISFAFAIYMIPGFLGKPLKAISAFTPPMYTQHIRLLEDNSVEATFRNYEEGMAYAKQEGKDVLIDFTGFGCVNCREMEQKVWNDPQVAEKLANDYVLISLFVDDKTPLPEHIEVDENGKTTTLRTIGDKWSYLQRKRFGANAQPFYVITDCDGNPLMPAYTFDTDVEKFMKFLNKIK